MRKILSVLGLLLLATLFFIGLVMGSEQREDARQAPVSQEAVGEVRSGDLDALTAAFGCAVPYGSREGAGAVTDVPLGSLRARVLTWRSADGIETGAVRPAEAAQLLRRDGLTLDNSTLWSLDGLTLLMASGSGAACAYYDDGETAFSLYLENADIDQLLERLSTDVTFPQ